VIGIAVFIALAAACALGCEYSPTVRKWLLGDEDDDDFGDGCGGQT
jgi:hypothetical protein